MVNPWARIARRPTAYDPGITGQAGRRELVQELLVGCQEHVERRSVLDLPRQSAGCAEYQLTRMLGALECRDLGEREVEIGRRCDHGRPLGRQLRRYAEQRVDCSAAAADGTRHRVSPLST